MMSNNEVSGIGYCQACFRVYALLKYGPMQRCLVDDCAFGLEKDIQPWVVPYKDAKGDALFAAYKLGGMTAVLEMIKDGFDGVDDASIR